jgi:hypothetical protein
MEKKKQYSRYNNTQHSRYNNKQYTRYNNKQESDLMFVKVELVSTVRVRKRTKKTSKANVLVRCAIKSLTTDFSRFSFYLVSAVQVP